MEDIIVADITAREIAERLNLSPAAVSLALNGKPGVSEKTRQQVIEMARQLDYTLPKNNSIPPKKKAVCYLIYVDAIVCIREHASFSGIVLRGVEAAATAAGYQTTVRNLYANQPLDRQVADILDECNGIILLGTDIPKSAVSDLEEFVHSAGSVPIVVVDNPLLSGTVDCVLNDNYRGVQGAIRHLLQQGCRHIGYLKSKQRIESFNEREQGIHDALAHEGLTLDPVVEVDISSDGAFSDINAWLNHSPALPDAFFAENDVVGLAAIRALTLHRIKVPERVAIVGFDDIPLSSMTTPSLTSVHSFTEELGSIAFQTLSERIQSGLSVSAARNQGLRKISMSTPLVPRESSRK